MSIGLAVLCFFFLSCDHLINVSRWLLYFGLIQLLAVVSVYISLYSGVVFNIVGIFGENLASEINLSFPQPIPPGASTVGGCVVADLGLFALL